MWLTGFAHKVAATRPGSMRYCAPTAMRISSSHRKVVGAYAYVALNLRAELKERVAAVVQGTGETPQAFMVEAIERETHLAEQRKQFVARAPQAPGPAKRPRR